MFHFTVNHRCKHTRSAWNKCTPVVVQMLLNVQLAAILPLGGLGIIEQITFKLKNRS